MAPFDFKAWRQWMEAASDLTNPFVPPEPGYYQLDPDWMPLTDLDEVCLNKKHTQAMECFVWWVVKKDWAPYAHTRPNDSWRKAMKKALIYVDFKKIGIRQDDFLTVLRGQVWYHSNLEEEWLIRRAYVWPDRSWRSTFKRLVEKFKTKREQWWMEKTLNRVAGRVQNKNFEPMFDYKRFEQKKK